MTPIVAPAYRSPPVPPPTPPLSLSWSVFVTALWCRNHPARYVRYARFVPFLWASRRGGPALGAEPPHEEEGQEGPLTGTTHPPPPPHPPPLSPTHALVCAHLPGGAVRRCHVCFRPRGFRRSSACIHGPRGAWEEGCGLHIIHATKRVNFPLLHSHPGGGDFLRSHMLYIFLLLFLPPPPEGGSFPTPSGWVGGWRPDHLDYKRSLPGSVLSSAVRRFYSRVAGPTTPHAGADQAVPRRGVLPTPALLLPPLGN